MTLEPFELPAFSGGPMACGRRRLRPERLESGGASGRHRATATADGGAAEVKKERGQGRRQQQHRSGGRRGPRCCRARWQKNHRPSEPTRWRRNERVRSPQQGTRQEEGRKWGGLMLMYLFSENVFFMWSGEEAGLHLPLSISGLANRLLPARLL